MACPVCFEVKESSELMSYARMSNHSWENSTVCDAHGICWDCMSRYVEIQILDEGRFNPKCPGEHCNYRLLPMDISRALERSSKGSEALERYSALRSECHEVRLKEILQHQGPNEGWLLQRCQPCPVCLTLVRREEGCLHVFCRCGCDFCFGCGGPDPEGCICESLEKKRESVFAAWLRTSPWSPVAWLQKKTQEVQLPEEKFLGSLHFFLWMAHADVSPPWEEVEEVEPEEEVDLVKGLEPITWVFKDWTSDDYDVYEADDSTDDESFLDEDWYYQKSWGKLPQKPIVSHTERQRQSRRSFGCEQRPLRWATRRAAKTGTVVAVPLQPQRQPRVVAAATRNARREARKCAPMSCRSKRTSSWERFS